MEYTQKIIRQVQLSELKILLKFDSICKKYNIRYQLFAGTLLGAVRHQGFIPWDDDIDVCMLREDYEKFISVCTSLELGNDFFLQTNKTDPTSIIQFAKLRLNNTVLEMSNETSATSHKGIWIDIFPLDKVKPETKEGKKQYKKFNFWYIVCTSTINSRVSSAKTTFKKIGRFFLGILGKIVGKRNVDLKLYHILTQFSNENSDYINHLTNGVSGNRTNRFLFNKNDILETINIVFEGYEFPAPKNYDCVLKQLYGDYMKLPPKDEQFPHHDIINLKF